MKQVLIKDGSVLVEDVPAPPVEEGNVLVRVRYSCVSPGTEMANIGLSALPLYRRALRQPENVRKVLSMARDHGLTRTIDRVRGKLSFGLPTGYSVAGTVIGVGERVQEFAVGDRVACAGAGIANHAEIVSVPVNLAVKVPESVALDDAATVTLGAIALQGVRRCAPTIGETVVVVGLGLLGQLTVQMLRANGCRVIGVDPDSKRAEMARSQGAVWAIDPGAGDHVERVLKLTDGYGADAAIITASGASDEIMSAAMRCCRRKGRVVLVGDVGLDLRRSDFYVKELDLLISTSYGPGRYDPSYEEGGIDYPLPYVRWTENRNMQAYLGLVADGRITLEGFRSEVFEVDRAAEAYESLKSSERQLLAILHYPDREGAAARRVDRRLSVAAAGGRIGVSVIGAGAFAQGVHLPNLLRLRKHFQLRGIVTRTGANSSAIAKQFSSAFASTDPDEALADRETDLVIIATRHDLHAGLALRALQAGKHVLVEKPLALTPDELSKIETFFQTSDRTPLLMTGFNRRFSPAIVAAAELLAGRASPMIIDYRMNAGHIPPGHWVHGPQGGGRNIGEACHIYDLFGFMTGSEWVAAEASAIGSGSHHWRRDDNFVATVRYRDGSVCSLTYTALGDRAHPKETMEIFCDGKVIVLNDYRDLRSSRSRAAVWRSATVQKGQLEELQALATALHHGGAWPISLESQLATTRLSFQVQKHLAGGA